jgi:hypothetical protein
MMVPFSLKYIALVFLLPKSNLLLFNDLSDLGVETQSIYLLAILHRFYSKPEKIDLTRIERAARLVEVLSLDGPLVEKMHRI